MNGLYDEVRVALHAVWNRRWLALAVAWALCVLGWLVIALIPNSYQSHAKIYVQMQDMLSDQVGINRIDSRKQLDRLQETLTSADNLEKVVRGTDLGATLATDAELAGKVAMLRTAIKVESKKDNLFEITAVIGAGGMTDARAARVSQQVVRKLIDVFEEDNISSGRQEAGATLRFLDAQLAQRQKELQFAEARRVKFETENLGLLPGVGSISMRMESARIELQQIDSQLMSAESALAALNGQLAGTPASLSAGGGGGNPALAAARAELAAARARGWTDSHPDVIAMKNQIAIIARQPGAAGGGYSTPNPAYSPLQSMRAERQAAVSALRARKASLQGDVTQYAAQQTAEPGVAAEMSKISRDYEVLKMQYDKLLTERESVRLRGEVTADTDPVQFRVIEPPAVPSAPAAPNRPLLLAGILFVGLGGGIATAFALSQLRTSFPTTGRLERASGLPVIGAISQMVSADQLAERTRKLKLFYGGTGGLFGMFVLLLAIEFIQRGSVA